MLQKPEDISQEQFLRDVESLNLRYPIARIVEETGFNKSSVSKYLSGKEMPSKNFLKAFYEWFNKSRKNVSIVEEPEVLYKTDKDKWIAHLEEQIKDLKQDKAELKETIKKYDISLEKIQKDQKALFALVNDAILRAAHYRYDGDKTKLDNELEEINNTVADLLK